MRFIEQTALFFGEDRDGKYATINIVVGEYMFERMVSDTPPAVEEGYLGYVIVSDEIDISGGKDITTELQALVDKYPGRTIYFSDGEYNISAPIVINADTEGAVSLRLSNYAVIKALPTWSSEDAMITVGSKTDAAKTEGAEVAVMGGVIDGAGVAKIGVSFENCRIVSPEFGWNCRDFVIDDCDITAEYVFFGRRNGEIRKLRLGGKYSFQYTESLTVSDCELNTKDAFWHAKNVTVRNCLVKGEYLGW